MAELELQTNALITVEEFRQFSGDKDGDSLPDEDRAIILINSASDFLENECSRKFITPAAVIEEVFDGPGSPIYYAKQARINDSTAPLLHRRAGTTWNAVEAPTFQWTYDADTGKIWFLSGSKFGVGLMNWKLTYLYGWTQAALPWGVKRFAAALVQRFFKLSSGKEGMSSESFGDSTTAYDLGSLTPMLERIRQEYNACAF